MQMGHRPSFYCLNPRLPIPSIAEIRWETIEGGLWSNKFASIPLLALCLQYDTSVLLGICLQLKPQQFSKKQPRELMEKRRQSGQDANMQPLNSQSGLKLFLCICANWKVGKLVVPSVLTK
jgi:hypothetical protein